VASSDTSSRPAASHWPRVVEYIATFTTIALGVALLWHLRSPTASAAAGAPRSIDVSPLDVVAIDSALTQGSPTAPVVMIVYSDFLCPYCGRFARETLPSLVKAYVTSGQAAISFKHLPIATHAGAFEAAQGTECAAKEQKFWVMHDLLFADQKAFGDAQALRRVALAAGVTEQGWTACAQSDATRAKVEADALTAKTLRISGTPSFVFGRRLSDGRVKLVSGFSGAKALADFQAALDQVASR
jgi:protein-disulfide isomerase